MKQSTLFSSMVVSILILGLTLSIFYKANKVKEEFKSTKSKLTGYVIK